MTQSVATKKYTSRLDAFAARSTPRRTVRRHARASLDGVRGLSTCAKQDRNFVMNLLFSLDYNAQEIYTLVSCIAASMMFIDWERRQTQPKAKQQTKATHSGDAIESVPRGVFRLVFMRVSRVRAKRCDAVF
jgi:hypothetical protein